MRQLSTYLNWCWIFSEHQEFLSIQTLQDQSIFFQTLCTYVTAVWWFQPVRENSSKWVDHFPNSSGVKSGKNLWTHHLEDVYQQVVNNNHLDGTAPKRHWEWMTSSRWFSVPPNIQSSSSITDFFWANTTEMQNIPLTFLRASRLFDNKQKHPSGKKALHQVLASGRFGWFKWPFQGLSDLHLADQKVTWKKLAQNVYFEKNSKGFWNKNHCFYFLFVRDCLKIWESLPSQKRLGDDPFLLGYGLFSEAKLFPKDPGMSWERDYIYRSGLLGISFREGHAFWRYFEVFHFCLQGFIAMKLYCIVLPYHSKIFSLQYHFGKGNKIIISSLELRYLRYLGISFWSKVFKTKWPKRTPQTDPYELLILISPDLNIRG